VLDVGAGSGYLCSALAALIAPTVVDALTASTDTGFGASPAEVEATLLALSPAAGGAAADEAKARAEALKPALREELRRELRGRVVGVEHIGELTDAAAAAVAGDPVGGALARLGLIQLYTADGRKGT